MKLSRRHLLTRNIRFYKAIDGAPEVLPSQAPARTIREICGHKPPFSAKAVSHRRKCPIFRRAICPCFLCFHTHFGFERLFSTSFFLGYFCNVRGHEELRQKFGKSDSCTQRDQPRRWKLNTGGPQPRLQLLWLLTHYPNPSHEAATRHVTPDTSHLKPDTWHLIPSLTARLHAEKPPLFIIRAITMPYPPRQAEPVLYLGKKL